MKILLTGAGGFLGWHTRLRLHALTEHEVLPVTRRNWTDLRSLLEGADAVIHLAGVNRGPESEVEQGNVALADDLAGALGELDSPVDVIFANSIQSGNGTPYGSGKASAAATLSEALRSTGGHFTDVQLPNLFGEHGRPQYNSFVATFIDAVVRGDAPTINDNQVNLLSAQQAADALLRALAGGDETVRPSGEPHGVLEVWHLLREFHDTYPQTGEFPDLSTDFRIDLFNAYRAALFPAQYPIALTPHSDERGSFVETVRARGGEGQTSFSTTVPGVTRGEHYHLRKIERFAVIAGRARISLRRMFTDEVIDFDVDGERPAAIDMPVGWVHNITNTGTQTLLTQFWSHELFRPDAPDTFAEPVTTGQQGGSPQ